MTSTAKIVPKIIFFNIFFENLFIFLIFNKKSYQHKKNIPKKYFLGMAKK